MITGVFLQRKDVDLLLNSTDVFCFTVGSLCAKRHGKVPVELLYSNLDIPVR